MYKFVTSGYPRDFAGSVQSGDAIRKQVQSEHT